MSNAVSWRMKLPTACRQTHKMFNWISWARHAVAVQCSGSWEDTSWDICVSVFGLPCDRFWKIAAGGRAGRTRRRGQGKNEVRIVGNRCR